MMNRVKAALSVIDVDGSMQPLKLVEAMSPVTCETTVAETAVHFARIAVAGTAYKVIGRAGGGFDSDIRAVVGAEDQGDLANLSVTALTQVRQDLV